MSPKNVKDILAGHKLSVEESSVLMREMLSGAMPNAQVAALLTTLEIRGYDLDMLDGFSAALTELALPIHLEGSEIIDVCGTGGDSKSSFNISTTVAFVLAGAGYKVAKHGNVGVSSPCGSSNVLEALGVPLYDDADKVRKAFEKHGVCFIHAPFFHPGVKRVAELRRELGFRTVFNALGPLINPARPTFQYNGVFNLELQRLYGYLLQRRKQRFCVVHTLDGFDEVSLTAPTRVVSHCGGWELGSEHFGMTAHTERELQAPASPRESASLIKEILAGRGTQAQQHVVIANAALAMWCCDGLKRTLLECCDIATESIASGKALDTLRASREGV